MSRFPRLALGRFAVDGGVDLPQDSRELGVVAENGD